MRRAEIKDKVCYLSFSYDEEIIDRIKSMPRQLRRWDGGSKTWQVDILRDGNTHLISILDDHFPGTDAQIELSGKKVIGAREEKAIASSRLDNAAPLAILGFKSDGVKPFQWAGIRYMVEKKRCFNGDEMGLGKTVQAIGSIAALDAFPCLYVTRAKLKTNVCREWEKWMPGIKVTQEPSEFKRDGCQVLVTNYDRLSKLLLGLLTVDWKGIVMDESQKVKNPKAAVTKAMKELVKAKNPSARFALTGTPLDARPIELHAQLECLGLDVHFGNWFSYAKTYCGAHRTTFGLDVSGATNIAQLHARLCEHGMVRRKKSDVMAELGEKVLIPIFVDLDNEEEYRAKEREIGQIEGEWDGEGMSHETLTKRQVLSKLAGMGKMEAVKDWLEAFHEQPGKKVVAFAYHREVQRKLHDAMLTVGRANYTMASEGTQWAVDGFQGDPSVMGLTCSLEADNAGHNLTAAEDVIFIEMGMKRQVVDQAMDRLHRIGQKGSVTAYFFIARNTIEESNWRMLASKGEIRARIIDGVKGQDAMDKALPQHVPQRRITPPKPTVEEEPILF